MPEPKPKPKWPGDFDADTKRLKSLQSEVRAKRAEDAAADAAAYDPGKPTSGMGLGMKMGMDLTVATLIGFGLGSLIDWPLGTFPLVALVLCGLGFAAGIRMIVAASNDYRQEIMGEGAYGNDPEPEDKDETAA